MVLVYRGRSIFSLKHLSQRMDFKCKGSTKYFALMLYRLFSAELDERRCGGNVNSIYCGWVYYEGWLLLGCPVFQPFLFNWSNFNLPFYCLKVDFHCRVILYVRTHVNFTRVNKIDSVRKLTCKRKN